MGNAPPWLTTRPTNPALAEPMNYVNLTKADQANQYFSDSLDKTILPVNFFSVTPSERLELVVLIQELRSSNSNLLKQVLELEQALAECQKASQLHEQQTHFADSMLIQPTQELAFQEQIRCLMQELEASHKTTQDQQILIESLTTQLESSQERVAQLEQEHSYIQNSYNEQSHQLVQTENTCNELRSRLLGQQHQTLQFKLALEKCLEAPVSSYQFHTDTDAFSPIANSPITEPSLFSKAQPIPPWSVQPQSLTNELEPSWDSPVFPTPSTARAESSLPLCEFAQFSSLDWSVEDLSQQPPEASPLQETFEEQMDALMDITFESPSAESPPTTEDYTTQSQSSQSLPHQETSSFTLNRNWPSPVVYPLRPPKGRKSLAAIQLPTFR